MNIPTWPVAGDRERELLLDVLGSPQWGGFHELVGRFERQFASYQQARYGVTTFNGTVSLEMMLAVAGIGPGDEVIVPAISFVSTATAVSRAGAIPVFVDIEPYSFNLDPQRASAAITAKTRAIIAVHFGGSLCGITQLSELCHQRGLTLFEDAAHAHGSEWNGRRSGTFGLASSFSFQNGKVMTAGEGGIVLTNDTKFYEKCRSFANQGRQAGATFFHHFTLSTNFRITAFQAAVLMGQLERLDNDIAVRCRNEGRIREQLADTPGLQFQEIPAEVNRRSHYLLLGRIDANSSRTSRDDFHRAVTARGIPCTPFYPHPLYGNPMYRSGGCRVEPCPVAEACVRDAFWFPHRVLMADDETIGEIVAILRSAL